MDSVAEVRARAQRVLAQDYFAALGIAQSASPDDIQKAFIEAAKTWHPDRLPKGLDEVKPLVGKVFARLELARSVLSDPQRRLRYIEELSKPKSSADQSSLEAGVEFKKAEVLLKKNDVAQAERHLRRAVQLAPNNIDYQIGLVSIGLKPSSTPDELKKLIAEIDPLLARDPNCARGYFLRAQIKKRLDRLADANADFARAAELDPTNVDAAREVRIFKMREDQKKPKPPVSEETSGAFGFVKKLFKK